MAHCQPSPFVYACLGWGPDSCFTSPSAGAPRAFPKEQTDPPPPELAKGQFLNRWERLAQSAAHRGTCPDPVHRLTFVNIAPLEKSIHELLNSLPLTSIVTTGRGGTALTPPHPCTTATPLPAKPGMISLPFNPLPSIHRCWARDARDGTSSCSVQWMIHLLMATYFSSPLLTPVLLCLHPLPWQ